MSYAGFGLQLSNSFRKPRRAFKPIFDQFADGEHPIKPLGNKVSSSWKEFREHPRIREMKSKVCSSYIYLALIIVLLASLLITSM